MDNLQPEEKKLTTAEVHLVVEPDSMMFFSTILQSGVEIETEWGISLGAFLTGCAGFTRGYLEQTVQTIFLNGIAIDNIDTPLQGEHQTLALSAAMPGLAGAIFRKNGPHSTLRTETSMLVEEGPSLKRIRVRLKLFNQIARERGGFLLQAGVIVKQSSLLAFFEKRTELYKYIRDVSVEAEPVQMEQLAGMLHDSLYCRLRISSFPKTS